MWNLKWPSPITMHDLQWSDETNNPPVKPLTHKFFCLQDMQGKDGVEIKGMAYK